MSLLVLQEVVYTALTAQPVFDDSMKEIKHNYSANSPLC